MDEDILGKLWYWDDGIPKRLCGFTCCRFCGVVKGQWHKRSCTWTDIHNPLPGVLFGSDDDWDNRG